MKKLIAAAMLVAGLGGNVSAQEVPANYPASYADLLAGAKAEGKAVIYSNMAATQWAPFVKLATEKYPWLSIEATDSGDDMWEKYYAESASGTDTADIMLTNSVDKWPEFAERGGIAAYDSPEKPALPDWSFPLPNLYTASVDPTILVYNKLLVAENEVPRSRHDVLELAKKHPDLKGKITTIDAAGNSLALGAYWTLAKARDDVWPLLEEIGPYMRPERSAGAVREKVTSGEYAIALVTSGAGIPQYERPEIKAIVGWLAPSDGVPTSMRNIAVTKAAKHPNAARLVLDLILSREGQIAFAEGGQTPYRDDLKKGDVPYETYGSLSDAVGKENIILIKPDATLANEREAFIARWTKALGR